MNNELFEVELDTTAIEHNETIIVGVFVLQSANSQMMELYYNFSLIFVMQNNFKLLDVLCSLLLPRRNWKIVSNLKQKQSGNVCGRGNALIVSLLIQWQFSSPVLDVTSTENITGELELFKSKIKTQMHRDAKKRIFFQQ